MADSQRLRGEAREGRMSLVPTREDVARGQGYAALSAKLAEAEAKLAEAERERDFLMNAQIVGRDELQARAESAEARVAELEKEVVFGFYEEEHPLFAQGYEKGINELSSPVTAEECKGYVDKTIELEDRVAELEKALEPFAAVASAFSFAIGPDGIDDDMTIIAYPHVQPKREVVLSTRNFSDARAALSATKEPKP